MIVDVHVSEEMRRGAASFALKNSRFIVETMDHGGL